MAHHTPTRPLRLAILALFVLASVAFTGCNRTKAPYQVNKDPYQPQQVYLTSTKLRNILQFGQIATSRDQNNLLYVTVPMRSTDNKRQIVEYRVTFYDDTNTPLPGGSWQTATLEPNSGETITFNSTTDAASDFQVIIREAEAG